MDNHNNLTLQNIKILNWNANGIKRQRSPFIDFLERHQITVACITETHLLQTENFRIPGFITYRKDRETAHASGGVAILIKRKLKHDSLLSFDNTTLENIGIKIYLNDGSSLRLHSVYRQPNKKLKHTDITIVTSCNEPTLIIGDLNSKNKIWGCRCDNPSGIILYDACTKNALNIFAPSEHTYFPYRPDHQPDILDIVISKMFTKSTSMEVISELDSDHLPVLINFNSIPKYNPPQQNLINGIVDWEKFQTFLSNAVLPPKVTDATEIDEQISTYTQNIVESINKATKITKRQQQKINRTPEYILQLINKKSKLRRQHQNSRLPALKNEINNISHKIKRELDKIRFNAYGKFLADLEPNDPGMWRATKKITKQVQTIAPIKTPLGTIVTDAEKCKIFSEHLEKVFTPLYTATPSHLNSINTYVESNYPTPKSIEPTTPSEIKKIIHNLPTKKSPGPDKIPNLVLKNLPSKFITFTASLFNACFTHGYFPNQWKIANILMFNKPGKDKHLLTSYRPISLLNTMAKLLEKVILNRLQTELEIPGVLPHFQFGFRRHHSTTQQLLRMTEVIENGFENKKYTTAVFMDVAQAFDKVWLNGLKYKILQIHLPEYMSAILFSFLDDRQFRVRINNETSELKPIKAGVPQGSILGPHLFNIYMRDIPTTDAILGMFADDTKIMTQHDNLEIAVQELQTATNIITFWFKKWNIKLNPDKCECKIFTLRRISNPPKLYVNNTELEWNSKDSTVRYLGLHFDTRLSWKHHINIKLQQAHIRLQQLFPILNRKSNLKIKCALLLYTSLLRPLLLYGCEVWGNASKSNIKRVQVFQNKILRIIVNAPWFIRNEQLHLELNVATIPLQIKKQTKQFLENLNNCASAIHYNIGKKGIHTRLKRQLPQDICSSDPSDLDD